MPERADIHTILIVGAGPIIIGQACEFDYSGTQACKALKEEGYRVILVNSNPATIMTDPEFADRTYLEPITPDGVEMIGAKAEAIHKGEDREAFKQLMLAIGLDVPISGTAHNLEESRAVAEKIGQFPLIIRPA